MITCEKISLVGYRKKVLHGFIKYLTTLYPEQIVSIDLFGSKARGDSGPDSDIDLLIIVRDRDSIDRNKIYDYVLDAELDYGINISLRIYNKAEFDKLVQMNIPFTSNVVLIEAFWGSGG